jgi:hypothetical protein
MAAMADRPQLTTTAGHRIVHNRNSIGVGPHNWDLVSGQS